METQHGATHAPQSTDALDQLVVLALFRCNDRLQHRFTRMFREYGLTQSQYTVLRILRDEGRPLPCLKIAERTITVVPGITGLIDRLEKAGMVRRQNNEEDRRVVHVSITPAGTDVLSRLDAPLADLHRKLTAGFAVEELTELRRLLDKTRLNCESEPE